MLHLAFSKSFVPSYLVALLTLYHIKCGTKDHIGSGRNEYLYSYPLCIMELKDLKYIVNKRESSLQLTTIGKREKIVPLIFKIQF